MHKIIRLPEVMKTTGLARSTIYEKMSAKVFPSSIALGPKSVGWLEADVQRWIGDKVGKTRILIDGEDK